MIKELHQNKLLLHKRTRKEKKKEKLQTRRKYFQTMHPTKNEYVEHKELSSIKCLKKKSKWKMGKTHFYKEDIQMAKKFMKKCSITLASRKM